MVVAVLPYTLYTKAGSRVDFWPVGHTLLTADQEHTTMKKDTFIVVFIQVPIT